MNDSLKNKEKFIDVNKRMELIKNAKKFIFYCSYIITEEEVKLLDKKKKILGEKNVILMNKEGKSCRDTIILMIDNEFILCSNNANEKCYKVCIANCPNLINKKGEDFLGLKSNVFESKEESVVKQLKIVKDLKFEGVRFYKKQINIDDIKNAMGIEDEEINKKFKTHWNIFEGDANVKNLSKDLEGRFFSLKKEYMVKVSNNEWVVSVANYDKFIKELNSFIEKIKYNEKVYIENIIEKSMNNSKEKLKNLIKEILENRYNKDQIDINLNNIISNINKLFPSTSQIIDNIKIVDIKSNDIQEEYFIDEYKKDIVYKYLKDKDKQLSRLFAREFKMPDQIEMSELI
ncbi:hypothetical protein [Thermobrachium celere]|uniref:hypothetical protein n=1 Tax=Thermobrachium celere TaxID=53422 RepID=UPI0019429AAE|nr:hypothetical protein [Thermobrachium celere]GFR35339.1 hypothetical protein TCEA9_11510 [Thermobrachium celere]